MRKVIAVFTAAVMLAGMCGCVMLKKSAENLVSGIIDQKTESDPRETTSFGTDGGTDNPDSGMSDELYTQLKTLVLDTLNSDFSAKKYFSDAFGEYRINNIGVSTGFADSVTEIMRNDGIVEIRYPDGSESFSVVIDTTQYNLYMDKDGTVYDNGYQELNTNPFECILFDFGVDCSSFFAEDTDDFSVTEADLKVIDGSTLGFTDEWLNLLKKYLSDGFSEEYPGKVNGVEVDGRCDAENGVVFEMKITITGLGDITERVESKGFGIDGYLRYITETVSDSEYGPIPVKNTVEYYNFEFGDDFSTVVSFAAMDTTEYSYIADYDGVKVDVDLRSEKYIGVNQMRFCSELRSESTATAMGETSTQDILMSTSINRENGEFIYKYTLSGETVQTLKGTVTFGDISESLPAPILALFE